MPALPLLLLSSIALVRGDGIRLEFDGEMRSRVVETVAGDKALGPFSESETLLTAKGEIGGFTLRDRNEDTVTDALGSGKRVTLTGHTGTLSKRVEVTAYGSRPNWLFVRV